MKNINENIRILWWLILNFYKTFQNANLFLEIDAQSI